MGYTHNWRQKRAFTAQEWVLILGETRRIVAKAQRGHYYSGKEDSVSRSALQLDDQDGQRHFMEDGAWRTFPHPEQPTPSRGNPILLAGPSGRGKPRLDKRIISLNGRRPHDYESFVLGKEPPQYGNTQEPESITGFCKTEYRPYDAVVVSILAVARSVAPEAIEVRSDGGPAAIRYLF